ncbi:MAG: HAD family phosphatase [Anaerolineales bacterium]|nr:HAD family phosphatase [Anaerolineales bacterium]
MSIRAIIWDLGGVLLRTEDGSARLRWEERLGLQPGSLERLLFDNEVAQQASVGLATADQVWTWLLRRLDLPESDRQALVDGLFGGDRVDPVLMAYIRGLRPAHKVGMITNAWSEIRVALENEWHIADAFDPLVISAEVGLVKPDPRIYRLALERLGVPPEEAVFIDDFEVNVAGARAVGMMAIRFCSVYQALEDLEALLGENGEGR